MVPRCSIIVRDVVPMGIAVKLQSIGQILSKVWYIRGPVRARITHASD